MAYAAKILKDSLSPAGVRLTTFEVTFPRIVLAEFNTHRVFSRNSASSRAIPVKKMLERVQNDPFVPIFWGKNQSGMQAAEELSPEAQEKARIIWLGSRDLAVDAVMRLQDPDIDLHKQIANRLLEPWLWQTVIDTATEWDNWWGLRCNPQAQPEIKRAADMMLACYEDGRPTPLGRDEWHLPLVDDKDELLASGMSLVDVIKVCVGRCARVSYLTHDGKRDPKADVELCDRLHKSGHMSPFEHAARPMMPGDYGSYESARDKFSGNFRGWTQARKLIKHEDNFLIVDKDRPFELHGV